MARYISFAVLLAIIVVIGALFYKVMIGFFIPVFLAAVLVVVFRPLHRWVCSKVGERDHVSAGITTTLILLIVLIPAGLTLTLAAIQGAGLIADVARIPSSIQVGLAQLRKNDWINLEYPHADQVRAIQERVSHLHTEVTNTQSYEALTRRDGTLQGDVHAIRSRLVELPGILEGFTIKDTERQILEMRGQDGEQTFVGDDLAAIFGDARQRLINTFDEPAPQQSQHADGVSAELDSDKPSEKPVDKLAVRKLKDIETDALKSVDVPNADRFSTQELAVISNARSKYIDTALSWKISLDKLTEALDSLDSSEHNKRLGENAEFGKSYDEGAGFPRDIIEFQREALQFSEEWSHTKNTLLGGEWVGLLRELANPTPDQVRATTTATLEYLQPKLLSFTGDSFAFLVRLGVGSAILLLSLYFFLCDGPAMIRTIMELSPLDDRYELELLAEFDRISRAIVLATVLSALFQGMTAGIGYYFVGMPSLILLTALTCTCSLVPFVGPAIVWVPVCIYLALYRDSLTPAIGLLIWGTFVVGSVDNVVKMLVLHGQSQLHPLLALLSVLGGIQALGPIGILIGPMVVVLLQTLLGILRQELGKFKNHDDPEGVITDADVRDLSVMIRKPKGKKQHKNGKGSKGHTEATSQDDATTPPLTPGTNNPSTGATVNSMTGTPNKPSVGFTPKPATE